MGEGQKIQKEKEKKREKRPSRGPRRGVGGKNAGEKKATKTQSEAVLDQRNADNAEPITYAELHKVVKQKASAEEVG